MKKSLLIFMISGILSAISIAVFLSPYASSFPDGLERVAEKYGFAHEAHENVSSQSAPAPDYSLPGIKSEKGSTAAAGLIGTLAVFVAAWGTGAILKKRNQNNIEDSTEQIS